MSEYTRDKLSLDNQVVKANAMINGRYKLSALEQKIVLILASKIKNTDNMFSEFSMTVDEFANFLNINNKDYELNRTLKRKCKKLIGKSLEMNTGTKDNPEWLYFHWFEYIKYIPGTATIKMKFSPMLEPYLLSIQEAYTKYKLGYVINFKSEYSFRFYELMKAYEKIGERTLTIEDIRELLMLEKDKYLKYNHLKTRVIEKAMEEINKFSDIAVKIEKEEKECKRVVGIVFSIRSNNYKYPIDNWLEYESYNKKTKEELQTTLQGLILARYKLPFDKAKTDLFCKEAILELIMELKNNEYEETSIKYPIPYFISVLQAKEKKLTGFEITNTDIRHHERDVMAEKI